MTRARSLSEKVRRGDPLPFPIAATLTACTPAVRVGMWWRMRRRPVQVDAHVVSFGNITAGGTGKTPAVIERAQHEIAAGKRVAVLTRGYGAPSGTTPLNSTDLSTSQERIALGDEAALILRKVPGVIVIKNADRVAGAKQAVDKHNCDLLLLDDGYQYTRLARDENVLLVDAVNPFGNRYLLPRGILREPLSAISRATKIILTRCDQSPNTDALADEIASLAPGIPVRKTHHAPIAYRRLSDGSETRIEDFERKEVVAACAIGHPESFVSTLESLGTRVVDQFVFPDHAAIPEQKLPADHTIVMTEKDAVRTNYARDNLYALEIGLEDYRP